MRINEIEEKSASSLKTYHGDAIKDDCTKCIPDELTYHDFAYVWWVGGSPEEMADKYEAFAEAQKGIKAERIEHRDMITGQLCVNPEKVQALLDNPTKKRPVIHRWNGYDILFDGNHRVTADILRGDKDSLCLVMNLDEYFDEDGNLK